MTGWHDGRERVPTIAIPVHDEVDRIGGCLKSIARQAGAPPPKVLLLLNNCRDGTAIVVRSLRRQLALDVEVIEHDFAPPSANAGHARALAMTLAAEQAGPAGVLLTTDADSLAPADWLARNLAALAGGAEVVCGQAVIDPVEALAIHPSLHEDDRLEIAYGTLLDELDSLIDPDPADPWPRHGEESGASLAVTVEAWRRAGGVPKLPLGEDRAFIAALRRVDARIRHDPTVHVIVSGRLQGRAAGGMAETMARRMVRQDPAIDDRFEPAEACCRRATLRAAFRRRTSSDSLAEALQVAPRLVRGAAAARYFGEGWAMLEVASPVLVRRPVLRSELAAETAQARARVWSLVATRGEPLSSSSQGQGSALDPLKPVARDPLRF